MWQVKPYTSKDLHQTLEIVDIIKIKMQKSDTVTFEKCGESHSLTKRKNLCIFFQTIKVSILQEASLSLGKKFKIINKKKNTSTCS